METPPPRILAAIRDLLTEITLGQYVDQQGHRLSMTDSLLQAQAMVDIVDLLRVSVLSGPQGALEDVLRTLTEACAAGDYRDRVGARLVESAAFRTAEELVGSGPSGRGVSG